MAIGVIWNPPLGQEAYDAVRERVIEASTGKGLKFHAAGDGDGGWRIIEVWESREALDEFVREDLGPAIREVAGDQGASPEPEVVFDVHFQGP